MLQSAQPDCCNPHKQTTCLQTGRCNFLLWVSIEDRKNVTQSRCLTTKVMQTKAVWMRVYMPKKFGCLLSEKEINGVKDAQYLFSNLIWEELVEKYCWCWKLDFFCLFVFVFRCAWCMAREQDSGVFQASSCHLELLIAALSKWCLTTVAANWDVEMSQLWILAVRPIHLLL